MNLEESISFDIDSNEMNESLASFLNGIYDKTSRNVSQFFSGSNITKELKYIRRNSETNLKKIHDGLKGGSVDIGEPISNNLNRYNHIIDIDRLRRDIKTKLSRDIKIIDYIKDRNKETKIVVDIIQDSWDKSLKKFDSDVRRINKDGNIRNILNISFKILRNFYRMVIKNIKINDKNFKDNIWGDFYLPMIILVLIMFTLLIYAHGWLFIIYG